MYDRGVVKGISIGCFSKKFFCWTSMIRGRAATTTTLSLALPSASP